MQLPFNETQCFFVAIIAFMLVGVIRGWRRELLSLVFILLAVFLVTPQTSDGVSGFLNRLPSVIAFMTNQPAPATTTTGASPLGFLSGPFWSLIIFALLVALGYYIGNKAFPKPATPQDRIIGIIPALIGGAFVLSYLSTFFRLTSGQSDVKVDVQAPNAGNYVPIIFVIAIVALVGALIAGRVKKAAPAKK